MQKGMRSEMQGGRDQWLIYQLGGFCVSVSVDEFIGFIIKQSRQILADNSCIIYIAHLDGVVLMEKYSGTRVNFHLS